MNDRDLEGPKRARTAADWYLHSIDNEDRGPVDTLTGWQSIDSEHADAVARCDAVMALAPRLAGSTDVGWAFDEAARIARTPPAHASRSREWYRRPGPAWATAILASAAAAGLAALHWLPARPPSADPLPMPAVANITVTPIVVPASIEQIRQLAAIEPVVRIANELTVDGRSIVVLPFAGDSASSDPGRQIARTLYLETVRQLAEIPGLYVIEPSTAAVWSSTEFSPEQIAAFLGVRGVVQGRVTTIDGDVTVDVSFTDAARDGLTWQRAYERPVQEVAMIRNDITAGLLDALTDEQPATY